MGRDVRSWRGGAGVAPWVLSSIFILALVTAAVSGRLWVLLGVLPVFALIGWTLFDGHLVQRIALWMLFISQYLMVVTWLHPDSFNYYAYAVAIMFVAGAVAAFNGGLRVDRMWWFVAWVLSSALYSTIAIGPSPMYALLLLPLGIAAVALLLGYGAPSNVTFFVRSMMAFAVLQALLGLSQTLLGLEPFSVYGGVVYSEPRNYLAVVIPGVSSQVRMATGTFAHFNGLGALLSLATPIAFGAWLHERTAHRLMVLIAVSAGLVATFSRGALLGAAIGAVLIYWSAHRSASTRMIRFAVLILATVLGALVLMERVVEYAAATNNLAPRLEVWGIALRASLTNPVKLLFGSGFGFFGSGFLEDAGVVTRLHSAPVQLLTELGLIGFALFMLAVFPPIWRGLRSSCSLENWLAGGAVAFLGHQVFDNGLFGFTGLLFFGIVSILVRYQRSESDAGIQEPSPMEVGP